MAAMTVGAIEAKDIYLSATGDDSNTGLTPDSPRKTLYGLNEGGTNDAATNQRIVQSGDVIHISGFLKMSDERAAVEAANNGSVPANTTGQFHVDGTRQNGFRIHSDGTQTGWNWCGISFVGENPETDGFDGEYRSRIFDLNNPDNKKWEFRNLTFKRGIMPGEGGGAVMMRNNANAKFVNCVFEDNHFDYSLLVAAHEDGMDILKAEGNLPEMGGAVKVEAVAGAEFDGCVFTGNMARLGHAIFIGGQNVKITNCVFEGNKSEYDGKFVKNTRGGAVAVRCQWNSGVALDIDRCAFIGNSAYNDGGALIFQMTNHGTNRYIDANITNSYFVGNMAIWENGGAVCVGYDNRNDNTKVLAAKFGNCAFYDNSAGFYGGFAYVQGAAPESELTFVNCTMAGNHQSAIRDTNAGHGCGIVFNDMDMDRKDGVGGKECIFNTDNMLKRFYNCVIENNYNCNVDPNKDNHLEFNDLSLLGNYRKVENLFVEHTCVGRSIEGKVVATEENHNQVGYFSGKKHNKDNDAAGFLSDSTAYVAKAEWNVWPLNPDMHETLKDMGDAKYWTLDARTVENKGMTEAEVIAMQDANNAMFGRSDQYNANDYKPATYTIRGLDISATDGAGKPRGPQDYKIGTTGYNENTTGIDGVYAADGMAITLTGDVLSVDGAEDALIVVYGASGRKMMEAHGNADLSVLPAGVYIATARTGAKHVSAKIVK